MNRKDVQALPSVVATDIDDAADAHVNLDLRLREVYGEPRPEARHPFESPWAFLAMAGAVWAVIFIVLGLATVQPRLALRRNVVGEPHRAAPMSPAHVHALVNPGSTALVSIERWAAGAG